MEVRQLEKLAREITGKLLEIYIPEDPTCKYTNYRKAEGELKPSTKYGVMIERGYGIQYDFKTTKNPETFVKTFMTQYVSKYAVKQPKWETVDGQVCMVYPKKEEVIKQLTTDRVTKYHYYTTLYGIGMFAWFTQDITKATEALRKYLTDKGISYSNEYSEKHWAYRFVINKDVETHNNLLNQFSL